MPPSGVRPSSRSSSAQDLDRLAAQVAVHGAPVLAARACPSGGRARRRGSRGTSPPWRPQLRQHASPRGAPPHRGRRSGSAHDRGDERDQHQQRERVLHGRLRARELLAQAGRVERAHPAQPRLGRRPCRHQRAEHHDRRRRSRSTRRAATRSHGTPPAAGRCGSVWASAATISACTSPGESANLRVGLADRLARASRCRAAPPARSRARGPSARPPRWWPRPRRSARSCRARGRCVE